MMMRLDLANLQQAYRSGATTPARLIGEILERIRAAGPLPVWLALLDGPGLEQRLTRLEARRQNGESLPLYGVPFAAKDNIDVAGLPTSAACPAFTYHPDHSATVISRLEAAGAIPIGKTNLDQFATGLVGVRSPFGAPSSVFNPDYISGGSSSGSAVATASGLVCFALGTDTAGSGRVPAAFNNLIGVKPTRGLLSGHGVVPACRSIDCVTIFAGCVDDAQTILRAASGFDPQDPFSRLAVPASPLPERFHFGVPEGKLDFCGDGAAEALYGKAIDRLAHLGGIKVTFDYRPFAEAAALLYQGPFVAERRAALQAYGFDDWAAMDPTVAAIIKGAERWSAADLFLGQQELARLRRVTAPLWDRIDVMALPTAPTIFTHAQLREEPILRNSQLGLYTNFVNLMDLSAVALPAGFRPDGLPFGVTLIGPAFADHALLPLADRLHRSLPEPRWGGTDQPLPPPVPPEAAPASDRVRVAVVGAHLSGQPLNGQLRERQARLIATTRTAPGYRFYALAGTQPAKPGLMRDDSGAGLIEVEVWEMSTGAFGSFAALVPQPLGIGTLRLEDGSLVKGFICEAAGLAGATDITHTGGWRAYLAANHGGQP
jgi:allophanate hydrolase